VSTVADLFPGRPVAGPPPADPMAAAFAMADRARRMQGVALDALGFGPVRTPSEVVMQTPGVTLRGYRVAGRPAGVGPPVLIVPAPIKRA
jgi:hypothetical protein